MSALIKDTNPKDAIADKKLPLHLVSGIVKAYQAIAHFLGNVKYGAWNYRAGGARASIYYAAANRHLDKWWEGEEYDQADGTPHLANALACINILIEAKYGGNLADDRPPSRDLNPLYNELEAIMERIRNQYPDRNPRHYTIADTPLKGTVTGLVERREQVKLDIAAQRPDWVANQEARFQERLRSQVTDDFVAETKNG